MPPTVVRTLTFQPKPSQVITNDEVLGSQQSLFLCQEVPSPEIEMGGDNSDNIHISGKTYFCPQNNTSSFDLDNGILTNAEDSQTDISFNLGKATIDSQVFYYFQGVNEAIIREFGKNEPSYEDCLKIISGLERTRVLFAEKGSIGCVLTNEGRFAFIRVEELNPKGIDSIAITFITWETQDQ
jgi:hypothetical protein